MGGQDAMSTRPSAVYQCAKAAVKLGMSTFAVRNGGECAASSQTGDGFYIGLGVSDECVNGLGGYGVNSVYRVQPGAALDLVHKFYFVMGQGLSQQYGTYMSKPKKGYMGDGFSSWQSAVDRPQQLALDEISGNVYFLTKGTTGFVPLWVALGRIHISNINAGIAKLVHWT
jgi:hypothetical protein